MDHLHWLEAESQSFLDAASAGSLDDPVPTCPGWLVRDLVGHLGIVQQFHGSHLARGVTDPPDGTRPSAPTDDGLLEWFATGADRLVVDLRHLGTTTPAWNFLGAEPATTAFWHRRLAHEAAVHRWDAQAVRGRADPLDPAQAIDGVDEVLDTWAPVRWGTDDHPLDARFDLELVDVGVRRTVVFGAGSRSVGLAGSAQDLLLGLWGRRPLADRVVDGDASLLALVDQP